MNKKIISLCFILFLIFPNLINAKPRFVKFEKELKKAIFVGLVIVEKYDENGTIHFRSLEFLDTINTAFSSFSNQNQYSFDINSYCTGSYPNPKDTVLIVIDSVNEVSLFAKYTKGNYRFWSPEETGSIALFQFSEPALKLPFEKSDENNEKIKTCWDGCLLPVVCLNNYILRQYVYEGYAFTINGEAHFIWDFADSQSFILEGLTTWTEKHNNKKITVRGALVFENDISILKNWIILE